MQQLVRLMDDVDDVLGIMRAAASGVFLAVIFLSLLLGAAATATLGLRGFLLSAMLFGVAIAAATLTQAAPRSSL